MKILMLLKGNIDTDARVSKEVNTLTGVGYKVHILLLNQDNKDYYQVVNEKLSIHAIALKSRFLPKNLVFWTIKYFEMMVNFIFFGVKSDFDCVHCHDFTTLPAGTIISKLLKVPMIYDSHEVHSKPNSQNIFIKMANCIEKYCSSYASNVIVTDKYRRKIISSMLSLEKDRFKIVMNLPALSSLHETKSLFKSLTLHKNQKSMVYFGYIQEGRSLEQIILALKYLESSYELYIVGMGTDEYLYKLKLLIEKNGLGRRVIFKNPVKWNVLINYIAGAYCSFSLYSSNTINNKYCSPNKLFESIHAGVPVIGSNNPLIRDIINKDDVGVIMNEITPKSIAFAVSRVGLIRKKMSPNAIRDIGMTKYHWVLQEPELISCYSRFYTSS